MAVLNKLEKQLAAKIAADIHVDKHGITLQIDDEDVDAFKALVSKAAHNLDDVLPGPPFAALVDDVLGWFKGCPVKAKAAPKATEPLTVAGVAAAAAKAKRVEK